MKIQEIRLYLENCAFGTIKGEYVDKIYVGGITSDISGSHGHVSKMDVSHDFSVRINNMAKVEYFTHKDDEAEVMTCTEFSTIADECGIVCFDIDTANENDGETPITETYSCYVDFDSEGGEGDDPGTVGNFAQKSYFDGNDNYYIAIGKDTTIESSFHPTWFEY